MFDQGDESHLCRGLPRQWLQGGSRISLLGITTPFGELDLRLQVSADGSSAEGDLQGLNPADCGKLRLWEPFPHVSPQPYRELPVAASVQMNITL